MQHFRITEQNLNELKPRVFQVVSLKGTLNFNIKSEAMNKPQHGPWAETFRSTTYLGRYSLTLIVCVKFMTVKLLTLALLSTDNMYHC